MQKERKTSPRLKGYNYQKPGAYFVTICTAGRLCIFGEVEDGEMHLNAMGRIAHEAWIDLPNHYPHVELDEFIVMPNHVHGIIVLRDAVDRRDRLRNLSLPPNESLSLCKSDENLPLKDLPPKRHHLSEIVRGYKTWAARRINKHKGASGTPVWMRSFYDHIVRDENDLQSIRHYIRYNSLKWEQDHENPINRKT